MPELINPQSRVPELDIPLVGGGQYDLHSDTPPEKFTILVAYRGLHCPKCKAQLQDIDPMVSELKSKGYNILAVSMDGEERAAKAVAEWDLLNIPVGYDMGLLTAKEWGLFISDKREGSEEPDLFSEPGLFVIKPDGSLYAEYIQNTPFGRPPLNDIIQGLEFVVEHDYPVRGTSVA